MLNSEGTKEARESSDTGREVYANDRLERGVGEGKPIVGFRSGRDECGDSDRKM
jgi:hypothetical protein